MPTRLDAGVIDNPDIDATEIPENALREGRGEYRVGSPAFFSARGRGLRGDVGAVTGRALYFAGFDGGSNRLIAHESDTYYDSSVDDALAFTSVGSHGSGTLPVTGTHAANKHFLVNAAANRAVELVSPVAGVTLRDMGMATSTLTLGLSVTQGVSDFTVSSGLVYWATEYDSSRGIESLAGTRATSSTFTDKDGIVVTISGSSANTNGDIIRLYRTLDAGAYPTGTLLTSLAAGTTSYTDRNFNVSTLSANRYGIVSIGLLKFDRDERPPTLYAIGGPFNDSLMGFATGDRRTLRFTPPGYYESWPSIYGIPLETPMHDFGQAIVVLRGVVAALTNDTIHAIYRLPVDSDTTFAPGEYSELVTDERGCVSRHGATAFTMPGDSSPMCALVARDGVWATRLTSTLIPLTDAMDWNGRVDTSMLQHSVLANDPMNRRLVFSYYTNSDTTHRTGLTYLDYQTGSIRLTHPDHGSLEGLALAIDTDGKRRVFSLDGRASNGQVYSEGTKDKDDSNILDSSGSVAYAIRTKEFMPGGPQAMVNLGHAYWSHGAGPTTVSHEFFHNRRDNYPEVKGASFNVRGVEDINLGRQVNSFSLRLSGSATTAFPINWVDIEGLGGGMKGGVAGG